MQQTDRPKPVAVTGARTSWRVLRWTGIVSLACGVLVLLAAVCAVMMPVSLLTRNLNLAPAVEAVYGSAREGRARLQGGYLLSWDSTLRLLPLPHLQSSFELQGADTRLNGQALTGLHGLAVNDVVGRAGPGLARLVPGAWLCDMTARVSDVHFAWGWRSASASGLIETPAGICARGTEETTIPALTMTLDSQGRDAVLTLRRDGATELAQVYVRRDRLVDIQIKPAAADVFVQLPRGGPINLQLPF